MPATIEELLQRLIGLRIIRREQADDALAARPTSVDQLLEVMERRQHLTSYQTGRIRRGEFDGIVLGKYKLLYRNASGSFARVFRAASVVDNSMVALKLLRERWAADPDVVASFRREAQVCMRFQHRNIVPIYEVGDDRDYHYFTMEFVEGGNLRDFIRIRTKIAPTEATQCLLDICSGLEYALRLGVTHRDLKMTNVLMSSQGIAKLVDFGLAGDDAWSGRLDGDGEQRALEYASLEKGSNAPRCDPRSDIFFAGSIYYELLTGIPAWPRTRSREERKQFSRYMNVRPIGSIDHTLPACVTRVVDRMLDVSPDSRYQTPSQVIAELRHAMVEMGGNAAPQKAGGSSNGDASDKTTILCVENRPKQQDVLREYFTNRGYRLLLMGNYKRAINRVQSGNPPDCLVVMGESVADELPAAIDGIRSCHRSHNIPGLLVLSQRHAKRLDRGGQLDGADDPTVLVQPVNLKQLRSAIDEAVAT